ncbi:unnamed protein product [Cuscuta campestris]|uniref:Peptidase A1 domain-containing protein n=1 Tax=Cuscuta campestris TaxID=132261 RepID=A0A484LHC8_9ASTE|nr:unnamed protein product [Cuscuta campestris]
MASHLKNNLVLVVSILTLITSGGAQENGGGAFTIELVHRDSPASPLYDSLLSQRQRMKSAFRHSLGRLVRAGGGDSPASVGVLPDPKGTYLVRISVGAAPSAAVRLAVADTGSDLIWLQCRPPCRGVHCSGQNNDSLVFSPGSSRTYKPVHCRSKECTGLPGSRCGRANKKCLYNARYNDGTYSHGEIAKDTFTLDLLPPAERFDFPTGDLRPAAATSFSERRHNVSFPGIIFGCGESNHFGNNDTSVSGIVGLGSSPYSLVNQIGGRRFSYCLVPLSHLNVSSKLQLGSMPALALQGLPGVVSTPLVLKPQTTSYYLTLLGLSVNNQTSLESATTTQGNIYIDSGTTFTFLPTDMYAGLEDMVKKSIRFEPMKPNPGRFLRLCYEDLAWEDVPTVTARFEGGEVRLGPANTFVDIGDGVGCLAFAPTKGVPVFGNVAHTNFLVEYDLEKMVVSFMPTDCVKWKY